MKAKCSYGIQKEDMVFKKLKPVFKKLKTFFETYIETMQLASRFRFVHPLFGLKGHFVCPKF